MAHKNVVAFYNSPLAQHGLPEAPELDFVQSVASSSTDCPQKRQHPPREESGGCRLKTRSEQNAPPRYLMFA